MYYIDFNIRIITIITYGKVKTSKVATFYEDIDVI